MSEQLQSAEKTVEAPAGQAIAVSLPRNEADVKTAEADVLPEWNVGASVDNSFLLPQPQQLHCLDPYPAHLQEFALRNAHGSVPIRERIWSL